MAEDSRERLVRYLDDAWAVEKSLVDVLRDMADEVNDPQVQTCFQEHSVVTHEQEERLEARIRALGEEPSGGKGFLNKMMGKVADAMQGAHDEYDKTSQDLMKAYGTENFECAMYAALEAYANSIGDGETAELARLHMQQERDAADRVWSLIAPTSARVQQVAQAA